MTSGGTENGGTPRARRRWWQLASDDLTAEESARQLWVLGHELEQAGARARLIAHEMGIALRSSPIDSAGRKLERIGRRWLARSKDALNEAASRTKDDPDWWDIQTRLAREDWAVTLMAHAARELELAAVQLHDDATSSELLRSLVEQLDKVYWHVHERDPMRRWYRFRRTGTDPSIRVDDPSIGSD